MGGLIAIALILGLVVLFDYLAVRRGVDTRPGFDDGHPATGLLSA
jgi:hypothetical protein